MKKIKVIMHIEWSPVPGALFYCWSKIGGNIKNLAAVLTANYYHLQVWYSCYQRRVLATETAATNSAIFSVICEELKRGGQLLIGRRQSVLQPRVPAHSRSVSSVASAGGSWTLRLRVKSHDTFAVGR